MTVICASSNNKLVSYSTEEKHIHDFGFYQYGFSDAGHSGVTILFLRHCIVSKIQDVLIFAGSNSKMANFFDRHEIPEYFKN